MSEETDEALMRAMFTGADRPPLADERFVGKVMGRVDRIRDETQAQLSFITWAGVTAAAVLFLSNGAAIVAELSRAFMTLQGEAPALNGGLGLIVLVAAAGGWAWLLAERA